MASLTDTARMIRTIVAERRGARVRYAYLGDHTAVVGTRANLFLLVDTRDRGITPHIALTGRWEGCRARARPAAQAWPADCRGRRKCRLPYADDGACSGPDRSH